MANSFSYDAALGYKQRSISDQMVDGKMFPWQNDGIQVIRHNWSENEIWLYVKIWMAQLNAELRS